MATARIAVFMLVLLLAGRCGAARATRHRKEKHQQPMTLDTEPAVRLPHALQVSAPRRSKCDQPSPRSTVRQQPCTCDFLLHCVPGPLPP